MPGLGLDARYYDHLTTALRPQGIEVVALDLPGFGSLACTGSLPADMVGELTTSVIARIAAVVRGPWVLLGHSMGGKVTSSVAARTLSGNIGLFGLIGVILLAPSPPTPEPMDEDRRDTMLGWATGGPIRGSDAAEFIEQNVASPLPAADQGAVRSSITGCSPAVWRQWLTTGSKQDVSDQIGVLPLPALILGGDQDDDLGAAAQPRLHAGTYPRASYVTVPDCGHLIALEQPEFLAAAVADYLHEQSLTAPLVPDQWCALIASERTIPAVRRSLAARAIPDDPSYTPKVLSARQLTTLRLLAEVVVPQVDPAIDVAARVDAQLARGEGDGWRPDGQPPDPEAYRSALDQLAGTSIDEHTVSALIDNPALRSWFEDARVDLIRQWLGHPASMARIGYDGFAAGSIATIGRGYHLLGPGERDAWEPQELGTTL
nr:alpha/beta hydrolase [Branchiibius hedensis]